MTGGISLRTARPADYDAIIAVVDDWWGRPVNSASIAFHAAMGFTVIDPIDGYDGPSSAKVLFERRLD
jgi:predicted GNAT superfamily acetyltransferase